MQADNKEIINLIKTAKGQLDGILRMVEEDRYCMDISAQLMATSSIIKKVNSKVIEAHIRGCVANTMNEDQSSDKLEEIIILIEKLIKNN